MCPNQFLKYDLNYKMPRSEVISPGDLFYTWVALAVSVNDVRRFFCTLYLITVAAGTQSKMVRVLVSDQLGGTQG